MPLPPPWTKKLDVDTNPILPTHRWLFMAAALLAPILQAETPVDSCRLLDAAPLLVLSEPVRTPESDRDRTEPARSRLHLTIERDGRVSAVDVLEATDSALTYAFSDSVQSWLFDPPVYVDRPVSIQLLMDAWHPIGQSFPEVILLWQRSCFDNAGNLRLPDRFWERAREAGLHGTYGLSISSDRDRTLPAFGELPGFRPDTELESQIHSRLTQLIDEVTYEPFVRSGHPPPFRSHHVLVCNPPEAQPPHWIGHFMLMAEEFPEPRSTPKPINRLSDPSLFDLRYRGGEVRAAFTIDEQGRTRNVRVIESTEPDHNDSVLSTLRRWRFEPARVDNQPVAIRVEQPISFNEVLVFDGGEEQLEVTEPSILTSPQAVFPTQQLFERTSGFALVRVHLDPDGSIRQVETIRATHVAFANAAKAAAWQSTYQPATNEQGETETATLERRFDFDYYQLPVLDRRLRAEIANNRLVTVAPEELDEPLAFPRAAHGQSGDNLVEVRFLIAENGRVYFPSAVGVPDPLTGLRAAQQVQTWKFTPPTVAGRAVRVWANVHIAVPEVTANALAGSP